MADCYNLLSAYGVLSPAQSVRSAKEAASKALTLDDTLAAAHEALAHAEMLYDWNWSQVEREYKRALELDPNYATAHQRYAIYLAAMGRFTEARAEIQRAQQADPVSLIINTDVGLISYLQHQNDLAIEQYRATLDMDPNFSVAHFTLGLAEEQKGQFTQAVSELERAIQLSGGSPLYEAALGHAYAMGGRRAEAEKILNALTETLGPGMCHRMA